MGDVKVGLGKMRLCCSINPVHDCDICGMQWCVHCWHVLYRRIHDAHHWTKEYGKAARNGPTWERQERYTVTGCRQINYDGFEEAINSGQQLTLY